MFAARLISSKIPGTDRQPSSVCASPSRARISGLIRTSGALRSSEMSMTITRFVHVDLRRRQPDPGGRVHRLEHVIDQLAE